MDSVVGKDIPTMVRYLCDINGKVGQINNHVTILNEHIQSEDFQINCGVDLLELKSHLLLSYVINLSHIIRIKSCNVEPDRSNAVDRLVEIRTVMEKMRSLEHKFSYQLDKLLRTASISKITGGEHPLQFKPVPNNLVPKLSEDTTCNMSSEDDLGEMDNNGLYVPPRIMPMPYKQDQRNMHSFPNSQPEKSKLMSELRDELTEFPIEVQTFDENVRKRKQQSDVKSKESYEEEYMMRLSTNKRSRDLSHVSREQMDGLTDFSAFEGLNDTTRSHKVGRNRRKTATRKYKT